ncbi:Down syndrome cell adhesion molecule-like protein Dscam2 [Araneus ventricosus]|uniref:Down syndrome cell adhesion molecule-like protein Dscam2 n=1 Tax=Araneus ventricosus TaxID=182803 RepID=A0A4Y2HW94_ARAVE|nr:Down syndrome cell adhesion molecule-like protein Dscam2 [Araneus ventricosus]
MLNFYRRFVLIASEMQRILYGLFKGKKKHDKTTIAWNEGAVEAFQTSKNSIAQAALLAHPNFEAKLSLVVDASNSGIAGTLQQTYLKNTQPLAFFSRKLTPAESSTDIRYISGIQNTVADAFSLIEEIGIPSEIDYEEIARAQVDDEELLTLQAANSNLVFKTISLEPRGTPLHCDVSTGNIRSYVPKAFRTIIINVIHSLAHSGAKATANAVKQRFIWTSLKKDCTEFCKWCIPCQKSKVSRHVKSPKCDFSLPAARFSHIHLDVVGPLPPSKGYRFNTTFGTTSTADIARHPYSKEDINASSAELVYRSNLRLPGQFLQDNSVKTEPSEFLDLLRQHFKDLRPVAASSYSSAQIFVYKQLVNCSHVFVRRDSVRRPIQQPYDGPFRVLQRKEKDYKIQVKDKPIWISINRLKPVFSFKEPGVSVSTCKSSASIPANKPSGSIPANEPSASITARASLPASSSSYTTRFGHLAAQFKLAFPEKTVRPGSFVSLICIANGNPAPQVKWTLDGIWTLSTRPGVLVSTYLSGSGDVISYVNITSADVTDSGVYSCTAFNEAGKAVHSRRLNVFGSLFIRPLNNLTALAGGVFKVLCPFGGYPFDSIIWKRGKTILHFSIISMLSFNWM